MKLKKASFDPKLFSHSKQILHHIDLFHEIPLNFSLSQSRIYFMLIFVISGCSYEDIASDCGDLNYTIDQLALAFSSR